MPRRVAAKRELLNTGSHKRYVPRKSTGVQGKRSRRAVIGIRPTCPFFAFVCFLPPHAAERVAPRSAPGTTPLLVVARAAAASQGELRTDPLQQNHGRVLTLEFYVVDRAAAQVDSRTSTESVAAFRGVDGGGRNRTQSAQDVAAIGIGKGRRADIAHAAEHVQLHTHVWYRLSSLRCHLEDRPRKRRSVGEQLLGQMRSELGRINDDMNVAGGVRGYRSCGNTRLISSGDLHAQQRSDRDRKAVTGVRAGANGTDAVS